MRTPHPSPDATRSAGNSPNKTPFKDRLVHAIRNVTNRDLIAACIGIIFGLTPSASFFVQNSRLANQSKETVATLQDCFNNAESTMELLERSSALIENVKENTSVCQEGWSNCEAQFKTLETTVQTLQNKTEAVDDLVGDSRKVYQDFLKTVERMPEGDTKALLIDCQKRLSIAKRLLQSREQQKKLKKEPPKKKKAPTTGMRIKS